MKKEEFYSLLEKEGIVLTDLQKDQFKQYVLMIQETNKVMNLTGIDEEEEMYEKHFYDSLLFSFGEDLTNKKLLDVGSGAGFPGVPLAIVYPQLTLTLLEPIGKRASFLQKVVDELKLNNVTVVSDRCEDYSKKHNEEYDIVTARAVSRLNILLELACQLIKVNGLFVALKGKIAPEELQEASKAMKLLNYIVVKNKEGILPSDNSVRENIFLKKTKHAPTKYPRNYSQIKSRPL
jgi:16S rRNA (guanine527-N7)-methyltransferase